MTETVDHVAAGKAAWLRLRNDRATFDDWIAVGRALAIGRTAALKAAGTNRAVGSKYNIAVGRWLTDHQIDGIGAQERYRALKVLEHLEEIERWRNALAEEKRRTFNHPAACWHAWKRATKPATPARQYVRSAKSHRGGHAIHWSGDAIRRAACAIREVYSTDFYVMARRALEAAVRNQGDLLELLPPDAVTMSTLPRRTDVVSPTSYVG